MDEISRDGEQNNAKTEEAKPPNQGPGDTKAIEHGEIGSKPENQGGKPEQAAENPSLFRLMSGPDWVTAIATVMIFFATVTYVWYARRQWQAMGGQLAAMNNQLAEMRKQAALTRQQIVDSQQAIVDATAEFSQSGLQFIAFNNGQVPAKDIHARIDVTRESFPAQKIIKKDVFAMDDMPILPAGQVTQVGPNRPWRHYDIPNLTRTDQWALVHRKEIVFVNLKYRYDDGFADVVNRGNCAFYLLNTNSKGGVDRESHPCEEIAFWTQYWKQNKQQ